jgi:hypothetical protein
VSGLRGSWNPLLSLGKREEGAGERREGEKEREEEEERRGRERKERMEEQLQEGNEIVIHTYTELSTFSKPCSRPVLNFF